MDDADQGRLKADTRLETRTRALVADGLHWQVREERWPTTDRRTGTCLIFDAETVVRRVRNFPPDWFDWSDADLYSLCLEV